MPPIIRRFEIAPGREPAGWIFRSSKQEAARVGLTIRKRRLDGRERRMANYRRVEGGCEVEGSRMTSVRRPHVTGKVKSSNIEACLSSVSTLSSVTVNYVYDRTVSR